MKIKTNRRLVTLNEFAEEYGFQVSTLNLDTVVLMSEKQDKSEDAMYVYLESDVQRDYLNAELKEETLVLFDYAESELEPDNIYHLRQIGLITDDDYHDLIQDLYEQNLSREYDESKRLIEKIATQFPHLVTETAENIEDY